MRFEDLNNGDLFISKLCIFEKISVRRAKFLFSGTVDMEPTTTIRKIRLEEFENAVPYDYIEVRGLVYVLIDNYLLVEVTSYEGPYAVPPEARKIVLL